MFALQIGCKGLEQHLLSPAEGQTLLHCVYMCPSVWKQYFSSVDLTDFHYTSHRQCLLFFLLFFLFTIVRCEYLSIYIQYTSIHYYHVIILDMSVFYF